MYSKARLRFWKVFFCNFPEIFKFFFTFPERPEQKGVQFLDSVKDPLKNGQHEPAEREPVERGAEGGEQERVEPRASRAGAQPQQEDAREHDQREEHVQQRPAEGAAVRARGAQRIEHEPEREAQHERERREHRLIRHRGLHPKSLCQKPSPRGAASE